MNDPMPQFVTEFKEVSSVLIDYGWILSPYMTGGEFDKVITYCTKIKENSPETKKKRKEIEDHINQILGSIIFHPNYRAFFVYRSKELLHIKKYSHYIERAMFHYYKKDFFSCVLCLLPAIEGVLLSYYGWNSLSDRKPNLTQLIEKIEKSEIETELQDRYLMYRTSLVQFLKKWIFIKTSDADFSLSFLNRHYVLHGMGNESFYTSSDCHRLILFFDLLIELLSLEEKKYYIFIPDNKIEINLRRDYYLALIEDNLSINSMYRFEETFLKQNENFKADENPPDWSRIQLNNMIDTALFFADLEARRLQSEKK